MSIKSIFKYEMWDLKNGMIAFLSVFLGLQILAAIILIWDGANSNVEFNGTEGMAIVGALIIGICMFREGFEFFSQNSIPRKKMCIGMGLSMLAISALLCAVCIISNLFAMALGAFIPHYSFEMFTVTMFGKEAVNPFVNYLWTGAICAAFLMGGYLVGMLYYLIPKGWKTLIIICTGAILFVGIPILDYGVLNGTITQVVGNVCATITGLRNQNPWIGVLSFSIIFLALWGVNYLLISKVQVQK